MKHAIILSIQYQINVKATLQQIVSSAQQLRAEVVRLGMGLAMAVLPQTVRARRANQEKHSNNLPIPTWNVKTVKYAGVAKLKLQRVPLLIILCARTNVERGTDSIVTAYVNHAPLVNILKITDV